MYKQVNINTKYWKIVQIFLYFTVLLVIVEFFDLRQDFSIEKLRMVIQQNSIIGFFFFILLFVIGNFIQIPGLIFLGAAVITLGKFYGGLVTYSAAITSCVVSFTVVRFIGGDILKNLKYKWAIKIFAQLEQKPIISVFTLRSIFQTLPLLNYAFALSGVSFKNHLIGTLIALPLPIFLYCLFFEVIAQSFGLL